MNNRSIIRALAIAALVVLGATAIGIGAYNAGVAQGIAQSAALAAQSSPSGTPYPMYPYMGYRPWGFGFFPIFPFFFVLLLFFVLRGLFWRATWRGGWPARDHGVPAAFEEWHRRAHAERPTPPTTA